MTAQPSLRASPAAPTPATPHPASPDERPVAVLPGGIGVREGVLMATLAPAVGADVAVVAALALRLAWVLGELLAAAVLTVARPPLPMPLPLRPIEP